MKKLKLLFAALACVALTANAQVMLETDLTAQFSSLTNIDNWTFPQTAGNHNYTEAWACPEVNINDGTTKKVIEHYMWSCTQTGDIFYATVTGLTAGTYKIELYGGAAFTFDRGFGSTAFTGDLSVATNDNYSAGDKIEPSETVSTGVSLVAVSEGVTYGGEIPIFYATNFPEGASTVTLNGVVVGESGQIKIGMSKTSTSTNWHVIQLKGVTATVNAEELLANLKSTANSLLNNATYTNVTGKERKDLQSAYEAEPTGQTGEAYKTVIDALKTAIAAFESADVVAAYNALAAEIAYAETLEIDVSAFAVTDATTAATALENIKSLKVAEFNYISETYTQDFTSTYLATPTTNTFGALMAQHWSGEAREYFDSWNGSTKDYALTYAIKLPEGKYIIKAAGRGQINSESRVSISDGNNTVYFSNNGDTGLGINKNGVTSFDPSDEAGFANNNIGRGWEWRYLLIDLQEETDLTLSLNGHVNNSWIGACDFALLTTADNSAINKAAYEKALAAANSALTNSDYTNISGSEKTDLEEAIAIDVSAGTSEVYDYAKDELEKTTTSFKAAKGNYDAYAAYKAETINLFGSDLNVAAPTTAAEALTAVQNLNIAQYNKVKDEYTYSLSGLIGDFGTWTGTATVAGATATPNYLTVEHWSDVEHAYYEQASNGYNSQDGWTIKYEKTCTLPAGDYVIKVAGRSSNGTTSLVSCSATTKTTTLPNVGGRGSKGINKDGDASWTDGEFAANGDGYGWQWRFLPFTLSEETEVTMTFYAEANSKQQWMSIADGELLSANDVATAVTYNEEEDNNIEAVQIANVTINRTIKEGFNTVVLPFDLTANQVAAAFGTGTEVYNYSENSENAKQVTVSFTKGDGSITANVPVLVKATAASESQTFEGVQIQAATSAKVVGTNCDFVGTYEPITISEGDYFIGNGAIYKSAGATTMNAFRAYINAKSANVRVSSFFIDGVEGTTTEIEGLEVIDTNNDKLYNLNGQEVKKAQKGLYIQNGKKIVVK